MTAVRTRAEIIHQLKRLAKQEMQIKDGIALMKQEQLEFRANVSAANRWGYVAIISKTILIPLHTITNALELTEAQDALQALFESIIVAVQLHYGGGADVAVKMALKTLKHLLIRGLRKRQMAEYAPGVGILIGFAEDSASLLRAAVRVSDGAGEMSYESDSLARMTERTMRRATAALQ